VREIDLGGRCVLPGLTDSHIHFKWFSLGLHQVDLTGTGSLEEMLQRVAERVAATPPGEWVLGRGWDQEQWAERRFPTGVDLDRFSPHHPVLLTAKSGHAAVANSLALQRAGVTADAPDPDGGRFQRGPDGRPTGLLLENAIKRVKEAIPGHAAEDVAHAMADAFQRAWQVGLTGIHDMDDLTAFEAFQVLSGWDALGLRVVKYLPLEGLDLALMLRLRGGLGDDWLRIGGIKIFVDGALGARTAATLEPYVGEPGNLGMVVMEEEVLNETVQRATAGGWPLAIHAIGDRANRMVLDAVGRSPQARLQAPHRIEHVQLLHPDDVGRLAAHDIVASMQPIHATQDAPMADRYWGKRTALAYAWRSLLDAGTNLTFGSDCPVEDLNPFLGIHAAVTRARPDGYGGPQGWHAEQSLTVGEAVWAYTQAAADAVGLSDRRGSLTPGKLADLVVVDRDLFTCPPDEIARAQVVGTMIGGRWVFGEWAAD
jgi:predicted amidohydrolase YtcJ